MNCEDVRELLGAYALGALDDDERDAVRRHLESCAEHEDDHAAAIELRRAAAALALAPEEREPPPGLEQRILAAARAPGADPLPAAAPAAYVRWRRPLLAAAAVVAAFALFGAGLVLGSADGDEGERYVHVYRTQSGAWMRIELVEETVADAVFGGLEPLAPGRQYQLWVVRDGRWLSVGAFRTREDGSWSGRFEFDLDPGDEIAMTVEPEGASEEPSEELVFRSRL